MKSSPSSVTSPRDTTRSPVHEPASEQSQRTRASALVVADGIRVLTFLVAVTLGALVTLLTATGSPTADSVSTAAVAGYQAPADVTISCDWYCHRNRNPPSSEPGTDYETAYGTPVLAAEAGTVVDLKSSNSTATGRYVTLLLDNGHTVRYLHLAAITVGWGQQVQRGQAIATSGASGMGLDDGYGPHVHVTLWLGPAWSGNTADFEQYVAGGDYAPQ